MKAFRTAAKKVEKQIAEVAAGAGANGDAREVERAVWDAINRLEDRTSKPEIRGDEVLREEAWATTKRLREEMRTAAEVGFTARQNIRHGQIQGIRDAERERIENMTPHERATYNYQQELLKSRIR